MHRTHLPLIQCSTQEARQSSPDQGSRNRGQHPQVYVGDQRPPILVEAGRNSKSRLLHQRLEEARREPPASRRAALIEELAALLVPAFAAADRVATCPHERVAQ